MPGPFVTADRMLTPDGWAHHHGLLIKDGRIQTVCARADGPHPSVHFADGIIVPGFIDVQVNGGGGVLFNDDISAEAIKSIGLAHARYGTTSFLPTLISDSAAALPCALDAVADAISQELPGVLGLHLEGPFLNSEKKGIHDASHFRELDEETLAALVAWKHGPLVLTIAPEVIGIEMMRRLSQGGVILSAGHTNATYEQTREALDNGLKGFTHLYNAMPPLQSRQPGPIAAALESDAWCGVIADGHHVSPSMLGLAVRAKTDGRIMLVSDAMAVAASDLTTFDLNGTKINVQDGRCVDKQGTLAGSSITLLDAVRYCVSKMNQPLDQAIRMATSEPASFLGKAQEVGMLAAGYRANFAVLSPRLEVIASFIDGHQVYPKD